MDNRIILNHTFKSEYFDPSPSILNHSPEGPYVDFYIFFRNDVSFDSILAFHVPYQFVNEYANSSIYSDDEKFVADIILHHQVADYLNDTGLCIEQIYLSLIEYLCYGQETCNTVNSYPEGGFGIITLFDEDYHNQSITSLVEPSINLSKFHLD